MGEPLDFYATVRCKDNNGNHSKILFKIILRHVISKNAKHHRTNLIRCHQILQNKDNRRQQHSATHKELQ